MNVNYLLLATLAAPMVLGGCNFSPANKVVVTSFVTCEEAGGRIMESHPRQCAHSDMVFVEDLAIIDTDNHIITGMEAKIISIKNEIDGNTVELENSSGEKFEAVFSIPNLGPDSKFNWDKLVVGNFVKVSGEPFEMVGKKHLTVSFASNLEQTEFSKNNETSEAENSQKAFTGEIIDIYRGKDGSTVTLKSTTEDTKGEIVKSTISIPNLGRNSDFDFGAIKKGNIITVVGDSFMLGDEKRITARAAFVGDSIPTEPNGGIGDGAESLDEILSQKYIGKTEIEAAALAQKKGVPFRVVMRDGKPLPTTRDFRIGRVNATVKSGIVVSFEIEGKKRAAKEVATVEIANPASTFCIEQGGELIMKESEGTCKLPNGVEMEEWEFFRSKNGAYLNKTVQEAESLAKKNNVQFRIVEADGEAYGVTLDFRPGRINAVVKNGKVSSYTVEGDFDTVYGNTEKKSLESTTEVLNIGPKKVECTGAFPQECYIVNGEYFYEGIAGFDFEPGYEYVIKVKKTPRCDFNKPENCPQDVGAFQYEFVEEISKKKVVAEKNIENNISEGDFVVGDLLIGFESADTAKATLKKIESSFEVDFDSWLGENLNMNVALVKVAAGEEKNLIQKISKIDGVEYVELNGVMSIGF